MILQLLVLAVCANYWAAGETIFPRVGKPPALNITQEKRAGLERAAYQKARELGYDTGNRTFELFDKDDYYLAYFYIKGEGVLGGDLIIVLDNDGRVLCFFRGQ